MRAAVKQLSQWWRDVSDKDGKVKLRKSRFFLWASRQLPKDKAEDLKAIAKAARDLEKLIGLPEWGSVLDIKAYFQNFSQARCVAADPVNPSDEKMRFKAACEWQAIESLFKEINLRIRRGKEAEAELRKIQTVS